MARYLRLPVEERIDSNGDVVIPLRREDVTTAIATLQRESVEAVAVAYLHAYGNPSHEQETAALLADHWPDGYVSASSDVAPAIGIYERTSTTVLNAYCGPLIRNFLGQLQRSLEENGFQGRSLIMQSNGGMISPEQAQAFPVRTLLSGPAAGAMAGCALAGQVSGNNCITLDMGGTSTDVCLIENGEPMVTTEGTIGHGRYRTILPMLDLNTIGAGGGSIAWLDSGRLLHVGPGSAGAAPGPVCYGLGGTAPTVTDANLVLGYIDPTRFFGGKMKLDSERARAAIEEHVGAPLGLDSAEAAFGIYTVVNTNMATAVREVSLDRGYDPRDFALIVGGGAGPIHACAIADEIGLPSVIVPRDSSAFSAQGMLATDLRHDYVTTFTGVLEASRFAEVVTQFKELSERAATDLRHDGVSQDAMQLIPALDLRYKGQYHEITVPVAGADTGSGGFTNTMQAFHARHDQLYGYSVKEDPIEIVNLRLDAIGQLPKPDRIEQPVAAEDAAFPPSADISIYLDRAIGYETAPAYEGESLPVGFQTSGPALIYHLYTTILVARGFDVTLDRFGNYLLTRQPK